ncbi:uncharacterized protein LOC111020149 [Momordica charantia]|uniref:Uncharacterized protein LOC111020149 n=1 Tax=Momordica charantia TaxID=3673 RepID=A0A6J1DET1_MOMCH|nr:uncharacterized protein LOC111020149 [Momordica charantia]
MMASRGKSHDSQDERDKANVSDEMLKEAQIQTFSRFTQRLEDLTESLQKMNTRVHRLERPQRMPHRRRPMSPREISDGSQEDEVRTLNEYFANEDPFDIGPRRAYIGKGRGRFQQHRERLRRENYLGSMKLKIPTFHRKSTPEEFESWEKEIELVFACHNYDDGKKVILAITHFKDYALTWWDKVMAHRRRNHEGPVASWIEFKKLMKRKFVLSYYHANSRKLNKLYQGTKGAEDYYKEMDMLMSRFQLEEDEETTMARFLDGLNPDIVDKLDLQHYKDMEELLHLTVKIEEQNQRRAKRYVKSTPKTTCSKTKNKSLESKPKVNYERGESSKSKAQPEFSKTRTSDIKCFKCHGVGHIS